jgi:hypothetical protein
MDTIIEKSEKKSPSSSKWFSSPTKEDSAKNSDTSP